jgi:hypothetical protein
MITATWSATGAADGIYTEADIIAYKANTPAIWQTPPTMVAGFDPAFSDGGDRSVLFISRFGVTSDGVKTLEFVKSLELDENTNNKSQSRTDQIVTLLMDACRREKVHPRNLAIDGTGAGAPFCDVVKSRFSGEFLEVNFGGKASDMPASGVDATPSSEVYMNRISEMWYVGREYIRSGQIRGVSPALATELCSRSYTTKNRGKVQIESKVELKKRIGKSPDMSDAAMLCLELCRRRLSMASKVRALEPDGHQQRRTSPFKSFATKLTKLRKW